MRKAIVLLVAVLGLIAIGTSSSWALYYLCAGRVYDWQLNPVQGASVRGVKQDNHDYILYDTSNENGYYTLNDNNPPPSGWYDYCAYKQGPGMASTSIYHTQYTTDGWDPILVTGTGPCPDIPHDK
jgi:hypothetical protein